MDSRPVETFRSALSPRHGSVARLGGPPALRVNERPRGSIARCSHNLTRCVGVTDRRYSCRPPLQEESGQSARCRRSAREGPRPRTMTCGLGGAHPAMRGHGARTAKVATKQLESSLRSRLGVEPGRSRPGGALEPGRTAGAVTQPPRENTRPRSWCPITLVSPATLKCSANRSRLLGPRENKGIKKKSKPI